MDCYNKQCEPIVTSKALFDTLYDEDNSGDLIALYMHYYYVAKWQETNTAWSTTNYTAKALDWSEDRVRRSKKVLLRLGLIEDRISQKRDGKFGKSYIYVRFMFSDEKVKEAKQIAEATALAINRTPVKPHTNALSSNSLNALSSNNIKPPTPFGIPPVNNRRVRPTRLTIPFLDLFPINYRTNSDFQSIWVNYVEHRKENKKLFKSELTLRAVNIMLTKIEDNFPNDIAEVVERFEWCITNGKIAPNLRPWANKQATTQSRRTTDTNYPEGTVCYVD